MKARKEMLLCLVMLIIMLFTGVAEAAPLTMYIKVTAETDIPAVMYMKEEGFSYSSPDEDILLGAYGKNETVKIYDKENDYYVTDFFGVPAYIHKDKLTEVKPKYSYTAKAFFKELTIEEGTCFLALPQNNGKKVLCEEESVYTIGQTKYWYKAFVNGKVAFIRKNSEEILSIEDSKFPVKAETNRTKYKLSLLSKKAQTAVSSYVM